MVFYMSSTSLAASAILIGSRVLSNDSNSHRHPQCQFAPTTSPPFDSQKSLVGTPGLAKMVFYMSKYLAKSAVLIGSMVLSIDSNLHRHPPCQFASTPSPPVDSQKRVVGPPGLAQMVFYMSSTSRAASAILIGSRVLSNDSNLHRHPQCQFAPTTSAPFDCRESIVGPAGLANKVFYMSKSLKAAAWRPWHLWRQKRDRGHNNK
jgi:hypothetical protein